MANMSTGGGGWPGPVVGADAPAAAGSPCLPVDVADRPTRSERPFCVRPALVGRGVTAPLSLSRAFSDEAGGPVDEELGDTAVFLPSSVSNPIIASKESVEGDNCTSEMLDSDMFGPLIASTGGFVCLPWLQQPGACFY